MTSMCQMLIAVRKLLRGSEGVELIPGIRSLISSNSHPENHVIAP